jgi:uncharacterized protein YbaR (Trm112 family)
MHMVNEDLLSLLVCPMGKAPLRRDVDFLVCTRCGPRFAIRDDIPNMLIEEAELPPDSPTLQSLECVRSGDAKVEIGGSAG